nr:probable aminopyrimidine aminohydrolase, mitochondrial isoform X1 [Ipomoea trifida]
MNFFQTVLKKDVVVRVLSSCWCGDLIRSAFSSGGLNELKVRANELEFKESFCTGEIVKRVESPIDKLQAKLLVKNSCSDRKKRLDVYIGDSVGDLACLLEAYAGIVVGSNSSLRRLGTHFGVRFIPLFRGVVDQQKERAVDSGILYTASSWAEIHAFVIGS